MFATRKLFTHDTKNSATGLKVFYIFRVGLDSGGFDFRTFDERSNPPPPKIQVAFNSTRAELGLVPDGERNPIPGGTCSLGGVEVQKGGRNSPKLLPRSSCQNAGFRRDQPSALVHYISGKEHRCTTNLADHLPRGKQNYLPTPKSTVSFQNIQRTHRQVSLVIEDRPGRRSQNRQGK